MTYKKLSMYIIEKIGVVAIKQRIRYILAEMFGLGSTDRRVLMVKMISDSSY